MVKLRVGGHFLKRNGDKIVIGARRPNAVYADHQFFENATDSDNWGYREDGKYLIATASSRDIVKELTAAGEEVRPLAEPIELGDDYICRNGQRVSPRASDRVYWSYEEGQPKWWADGRAVNGEPGDPWGIVGVVAPVSEETQGSVEAVAGSQISEDEIPVSAGEVSITLTGHPDVIKAIGQRLFGGQLTC